MGFYDSLAITEGAMYANLDIMDLVENTNIRDLPVTSSLVEDALISIAESEENYNSIMKACAYNELSNFNETGTEYVFTEAAAGGFIDTAREFFRNIWQKIQSLFKKFAAMIGQYFQSDKTFVEKNKETIVNGLSNIPDNAEYKGYSFSGLSGWVDLINTVKANASLVLNDTKALQVNHTFDTVSDDYDRDKAMALIRGSVAGEDNTEMSQSEFNKAMYERFRGSDSKDEIKINVATVNDCMKTLTNSEKVKQKANTAYQALKNYFDKLDTALNKLSRSINNSYGKDGTSPENISNSLIYLKRAIDLNKMTASAFQSGNAIYLTCLKDYNRQCKAICVKVATYKDASKVKNEGGTFRHYEGVGFLENVVLK